jgi:hypothetical protein
LERVLNVGTQNILKLIDEKSVLITYSVISTSGELVQFNDFINTYFILNFSLPSEYPEKGKSKFIYPVLDYCTFLGVT